MLEPIWKKKWMSNGMYELIMLSKTMVITKPELLTTTLLFWNTRTNTFDFQMDPISPTILNMAQVLGPKPSGRCVDVTYDWSSPSCSTAEGSGTSDSIICLKYTPSTFKSYGVSFTGFIPFSNSTFSPSYVIVNRDQEHVYFLLYWLNKHVFPNKSKGVKLKWIPFGGSPPFL